MISIVIGSKTHSAAAGSNCDKINHNRRSTTLTLITEALALNNYCNKYDSL